MTEKQDKELVEYAEKIGVSLERVKRITPEDNEDFCFLCNKKDCENCFSVNY